MRGILRKDIVMVNNRERRDKWGMQHAKGDNKFVQNIIRRTWS